ncbi:MAG TPA: outer membrane beta-barrel family protein [Caulobacter sp.]|nr:outer membrane beta-barrel family protein [Caulobacter sp.]
MSQLKFAPLVGLVLALPAGAALAQTPPPPPAQSQAPAHPSPPVDKDKSATVEGIVVTAETREVKSSIDAVSYSLDKDLQTTTGTLADVLRNVPSVEVDPNGNVSLRGNPGVTILIDGRPSVLLSGESRAQAVLTLPASQYSRVEVMTNPSAAYSPEGTAGVINLITKPTTATTGKTTSGSVRANVGEDGRANLGVTVSHTRDRLTLTADASLRHEVFKMATERLRESLDIPSGQFLAARQTQVADGGSDVAFARLGAEYRLDAKTQLTGELRYHDIDNQADGLDSYEAEDASGGVGSAWRRRTRGGYAGEFAGATGRLLRRFDDKGHEWSTDLRLDRVRAGFDSDAVTETLVPLAPPVYETIALINNVDQLGLTSAYVRPLTDGGKLRAGYDLRLVSLELGNRVRRGPSPANLAPDPLVSNDFLVDEAIHALYATWERPFGDKLSAQFGLRLEQVNRDLDQATTGIRRSTSAFDAYPTLHLSYELSDTQSVRASYSRRVQRPRPSELNPFLTYQDPLNYSSGNPDLDQQETDSFELMWQRRIAQTFYQATLYYRDTSGAFTPVTTDIGGGVLLTRPENLGGRKDVGLELVANGRLHPTLRYNASVNLLRQEIDAAGIPGGVDRSGQVVNGRLSLNWQPTTDDFVQVTTMWTGRQLLAQGERESATLVNLGYRRKLTESLSFQLTVRDLFDNFGDTVFLDTPQFRDRTERLFGGRSAFVGLTWTFGAGKRPQDPAFDFSGPQTGG